MYITTKRYDGLVDNRLITFYLPKKIVEILDTLGDNRSEIMRDMLHDFMVNNQQVWKGNCERGIQNCGFSIDEGLLTAVDILVSRKIVKNRSEAIRFAILEGVSERLKTQGEEDENE